MAPTTTPAVSPDQPSALGTLIESEVQRAEDAYEAGRSRALNVVAVSSGLTAIVSGFLAVAAGSRKDILPTGERWVVLVALGAFVVAAVCALIVNVPAKVDVADETTLKNFVENSWSDQGWDQQVAKLRATYLHSVRTANSRAANWLIWAIGFEVVGLIGTVAMAFGIVLHLPT